MGGGGFCVFILRFLLSSRCSFWFCTVPPCFVSKRSYFLLFEGTLTLVLFRLLTCVDQSKGHSVSVSPVASTILFLLPPQKKGVRFLSFFGVHVCVCVVIRIIPSTFTTFLLQDESEMSRNDPVFSYRGLDQHPRIALTLLGFLLQSRSHVSIDGKNMFLEQKRICLGPKP